MKYRWILSTVSDENVVENLARTINVPETIAKILVGRGIETFESAREFFRPNLADLHDPFLMDGMDKAVERSIRALDAGESIAIYGDYDVDGTNSAAMLYLFFKEMGATVDYYIPDRFTEGYGVSRLGIDRLAEAGHKLIITIDCGITAVDQVRYASEKGIDVIICDHHEAGAEIPPAVAVLDPIKPGCDYPFKFLSGCGVGFKLIQGVAQTLGKPDIIWSYLDFVAIAAAADIVPLTGENRLLVTHGLRKLNDSPRAGIRGLLECAGMNSRTLNTSQIVFGIAPRINAAGRMGVANRAVRMLIEDDEIQAFRQAQELETANRERRSIDEETFAEADAIARELLSEKDYRLLVIHNPNWHAGVIGIVASRLVERFYMPTVLMTTVDGIAKGSARSIPGFDIYNALKQCEEHIEQFGGHKYAAGLSVREENIPALRTALNDYAGGAINENMLTPELYIDAEMTLEEITPRFFKLVKQFAPFGPGNTRPVFMTRNAEIIGYPRIVGRDHLKFRVRLNEIDASYIEAIGFGMGNRIGELKAGKKFHLAFNIDENEYRGTVTKQLRIHDFRTSDEEVEIFTIHFSSTGEESRRELKEGVVTNGDAPRTEAPKTVLPEEEDTTADDTFFTHTIETE
ncbi:MAG: single-stranded-DNA-specific exonuclease RecJ [Candidatus Kapaibacterium sp.]